MDDFLVLVEYMEQGSGSGPKMVGDKETKPQSTNIVDLLNQNHDPNDLNNASKNTPAALPFPITKAHLDKIAAIYTDIATMIADFDRARHNPNIKDNSDAESHIEKMNKKLKHVLNILKSLEENFDGIDPNLQQDKY